MGDTASSILPIGSGSFVDIFSLALMYFGPVADSKRSSPPDKISYPSPLITTKDFGKSSKVKLL